MVHRVALRGGRRDATGLGGSEGPAPLALPDDQGEGATGTDPEESEEEQGSKESRGDSGNRVPAATRHISSFGHLEAGVFHSVSPGRVSQLTALPAEIREESESETRDEEATPEPIPTRAAVRTAAHVIRTSFMTFSLVS
ncbi:hypothetical protein [Streptomyces sp. NPDC058486]|uniref:hypothetical protein n=1 Tax=unclassified Streptomyces TaxID=2593676 RepID=UPI003655ED4E